MNIAVDGKRRRVSNLMALTLVLILGSGLVGCGGGENGDVIGDQGDRWSDECSSDSDCTDEQPYCRGGECYPCLEDDHCGGEQHCVDRAAPDATPLLYCSECEPGWSDSEDGCAEGEVCTTANCDSQTYECEEKSDYCVDEEELSGR